LPLLSYSVAYDRCETVTINVTVNLTRQNSIDFSLDLKYTGSQGGIKVSRLALYLFGPPRFECDGVPIKVGRRKATALLAYLAVTGEKHRRSSLINLLWPEYDQTRGRAVLRRILYALRKALPGDCLDADREEIGLNTDAGLWVDVDQFRQDLARCESHGHPGSQVCPACVDPLSEAVDLYRGDFMSGFGLKDSVNFDDWQFFEASALRRELSGALARLVEWHASQHNFEPAVGYARRRQALDPLNEQVHRQLMRLYAWSGQRSAAIRQFEECVALLKDDLGVEPQEATTGLWRAIKQGHLTPPPILAPLTDLRAAPPPFLEVEERAERPVFVARERELAQLSGFLDAALADQGQVVFVTGGAGCGKTALIHEFARHSQAAQPGLIVAWGNGNAHTGIGDPYLPFREVLALLTGDVAERWEAGAMTGEQARRLWRLLPLAVQALVDAGPDLIGLLMPGAPLVKRAQAHAQCLAGSDCQTQLEKLVGRKELLSTSTSLQQSALFEQYTQVLRTLASRQPLLLALDDLQWADGGSLNLLFHLGRRIEGSRILIIAAYRPDEVALGRPASAALGGAAVGGERGQHPLEPIVHEFRRTFGDIDVDLERAEGRQFVDAFLDSEPNRLGDVFRETLHEHTRGYALFTVELLRGMQARGDLAQDPEGRWVEGPALDWETLPARVEAVIAQRIGRLPPGLQAALAVASVEGETFSAEVLARVEQASVEETVRFLSDQLGRKHQLVSAQGILRVGDRCLSQYRFRHILYQKHLYNGLDPVKRTHLHREVGSALETLYEEGGEAVAVGEASAAQLARHFEEAGFAEKAVGYLLQAGERAQRLYANQEADGYFRQALRLLEGTPSDGSKGDWRRETATRLYENLGDILEWTGEHDKARASYEQALASVPKGDPIWKGRLQRKKGNIWRLQRRYEEAIQNYELAESTLGKVSARSAPERWQEWVQIQLERMWLYYWLGEWHHISALADQVRPIVELYGTPTQCISFFLSSASMYSRRDRYVLSGETLAFCQTALAIAQESENLAEIAWARFMLGFSQLWCGHLDEAEKQMQEALELAQRTGDVVHQSRCLTYLTILYRNRSHLDETRQYVSRSQAAAKAARMVEYTGMAQANRAWLAWREGDLAQAEADGRAALELWRQLPASHSSCAFQWTALWPLIGVTVARDRTAEASEYVRALLDTTQQRLPGNLEAAVGLAGRAFEEGDVESARIHLRQAIELAQELGYL
jgi:DNA-binding SARP family transcriptional activator/tetratricopeptide (TPR) repeat protein